MRWCKWRRDVQPETVTLRRSALFVPGSNSRALAKARAVDADVLIFDLEDSVASAAKAQARAAVGAALRAGGYDGRELVVRVNAVDSAAWAKDVQAVASLTMVDAVLLPKVNAAATVVAAAMALQSASTSAVATPALWVMVESAAALMALAEVTAVESVACLVVGAEDLAVDLAVPPTPARLGLLAALSQVVVAARARGLTVLDGVHADIGDEAGLARMCEQGRNLGFDGKTLVHPSQVDVANRAFRPTPAEVAAATVTLAAWESRPTDAGVIAVDGRMVEELHATQARRVLALDAAAAVKG